MQRAALSRGPLGKPDREWKNAELAFFLHDYRYVGGDFSMEAYLNSVLSERFDGLVEVYFSAINMEALLFERIGDVFRRDGAEQLIVLADAVPESKPNAGKQFRQIFGIGLLLGFPAQPGLALLLDNVAVCVGCGNSQFLRQQEVSGISVGHLDDGTAAAERFDIFSENYVHDVESLLPRPVPRTAAERCCAPV